MDEDADDRGVWVKAEGEDGSLRGDKETSKREEV